MFRSQQLFGPNFCAYLHVFFFLLIFAYLLEPSQRGGHGCRLSEHGERRSPSEVSTYFFFKTPTCVPTFFVRTQLLVCPTLFLPSIRSMTNPNVLCPSFFRPPTFVFAPSLVLYPRCVDFVSSPGPPTVSPLVAQRVSGVVESRAFAENVVGLGF